MAPSTADDIPVHRGDLIEFHRWLYSHFAVYTESDVAGNIEGSVGDRFTVGVDRRGMKYDIVQETIRKLCKPSCQVNNLEEAAEARGLFAREPDVIVRRAHAFSRQGLERRYYNLFFENCEHFATLCRYEERFSQQVNVLFLYLFISIVFFSFWFFELSIEIILTFISIIAFDVFGKRNYLLKPLVVFFLTWCSFFYFKFFPIPDKDTLDRMQKDVQQNEED